MTNNKAKKSKILALILGLTMCLALMLGIVFASPTSTVYAEGATFENIEINGDTDVTSTDGTYTYTKSNKTLILNNYNGGQFRLNDDATLVLQGNNFITVDKTSKTFGSSSYPYYAGIDSKGAIAITGSGSLAINVETSDVEVGCYGISVDKGMTINDGNISININSFYGRTSIGLLSSDGSIKVEGSAILDIKAKGAAMETSNGDIILSGTGGKKY